MLLEDATHYVIFALTMRLQMRHILCWNVSSTTPLQLGEGVEIHCRMVVSWVGNMTLCVSSVVRNTLPTHGVDDNQPFNVLVNPFFWEMQPQAQYTAPETHLTKIHTSHTPTYSTPSKCCFSTLHNYIRSGVDNMHVSGISYIVFNSLEIWMVVFTILPYLGWKPSHLVFPN